MSSYIIAGSADSIDTAYCQQIAKRIKAKYKNIDFRVVIKHPSEWQEYLNQICRIYGFLKKSNPIIYTYHGKIIGNKDAFINNSVKYFGLNQQSLIVSNLSTAVNVKLANQELQRKKAIKNNVKTLPQRIKLTYDKLLKQGMFKYQFQTKSQFLLNGIQYYFRQVSGLCPPISFPVNFDIPTQSQNITASNINLLQLSIQDKIIVQQPGKQPFVTNQANQQLNTQSMQRMSQASRTNKLQSSVISKDQHSNINKQSNQQKQKIDQQFDDVADYNNVNMENTLVYDLGDHFCLAFQTKSYLPGQMVLYHNQSHNNGNFMRIYNDRPVIGHHNIIKQIHYIGQQAARLQSEAMIKQIHEQQIQQGQGKQEEQQNNIRSSTPNPAQKSKTQPNIPQNKAKQPLIEDQALSEPCSDLNLISNLNYHTLYILKPLSSLQLRYLLHLLKQTNTVACLQFLPQNPNPKIKVYNRQMLLQSQSTHKQFPIQNFIKKQLQDGQIQQLTIPHDWQQHSDKYKTTVLKIKQIGYNHIYYPHPQNINQEELSKVIKYGIDQLLLIQEEYKKYIGYNLIITKKYTLIIALTQPYRVYGNNSLYFDGLAYLGYVQIAKVLEGYKLKEDNIDSGKSIRQALARCSGYQFID